MRMSSKPWGSISESDYKDANAYCSACLVDMNPSGAEKTKAMCHLPVKEPDGAVNRNGLHAAAAALAGARGGVKIPPEEKRKAARKLMAMYNQGDMTPPDSLKRLAGG